MVNYGGTFLESEVNELRAIRKVVVFSFLLIPYWMIYSQVKTVTGTVHFKTVTESFTVMNILQSGTFCLQCNVVHL